MSWSPLERLGEQQPKPPRDVTQDQSLGQERQVRPEERFRRLRELATAGFTKGAGALVEQTVKLGASAAGPLVAQSGRVIAATNLVGATLLGNLAGQLSGSPAETVGVGVVAAVAGGLVHKAAEAAAHKLFRKPGREEELSAKVAEYGRRIEALERVIAHQQDQLLSLRTSTPRPGRRVGRLNPAHSPGRRGPHRGGTQRDLGR